MKKLIIFAWIAISLTGMAQKATLKGEMKGFGEGAKMVVSEARGNKVEAIDTVDIAADGSYKMVVNPNEMTLYILTLNRPQSPVLHMMLDEGEVVTMNAEYVAEYNYAKVTEVKGSCNAEVYKRFNNALMEPNSPALIVEALKEYKHCLMSAFVVTYFDQDFENYYEIYEEVLGGLKKKYGDNSFVKYIDDKVSHAILPGKMAPEIAMLGVDGKTRRLSDLRGKVVLIDFWASWCNPCRRENPHVVALYHKYKDMGFEIYSVSLDKSKEAWLKAIKDDGLVWENHVSDLMGWSSTAGRAYGINSVPSTVLIDREGKVIVRNLRGGELEKAVQEALNKK